MSDEQRRMIGRREFCLSAGVGSWLAQTHLAAATDETFLPRVFRNARGESMPYRLFVPQGYERRKRYPLVVWLHGGAGRGGDNLRQISGGNTTGSRVWTLPENQARNPCFVVAPQCPDGAAWATLERAEPTRQLGLVLELLQSLRADYSLDARRLYVAGQSLGGFGTWSIISQHPDLFAAAIPICGGGDETKASRLKRMSIWAFHGERDEAVGVERSRRMIEAVRRAGGRPNYTEYKGEGHAIWDRTFREPELLAWVFAQSAKG